MVYAGAATDANVPENVPDTQKPALARSAESAAVLKRAMKDKGATVAEAGATNGHANTNGVAKANGITNGSTSGQANGIANGSTSGQANGITNGSTSGQANGITNGSTSGQANGSTSAQANGSTNGQANGITNGSTNGQANGITNGSTSAQPNGSTNGQANGITNGNTNRHANGSTNGRAPAPIKTLKNGTNGLKNEAYKGEITMDGKDPMCDADNPTRLQFEDVTSAAFKIKGGVLSTPCMLSHLSGLTGMDIYLKQDFLQFTGSFKERGARYALMELPASQKARGVISASLGNHALALSYHGKLLGISVTVVMPLVAPMMKIQCCRQHGATVVVQGQDMAEAKAIAMRMAREEQLAYINGYDHPHIMAGQGTLGLEILEQVPDVDAIVVPVGGGGLIAGIATAVKSMRPNVEIIGVESERCASFSAALKAGKPVAVANGPTIADGLAVPTVGYNAFVTAAPLVDRMVVVKEEVVAVSILRLVELEKCVVEGAAACGLAAILEGQLDDYKGKKLVLLLCGGNIDTTVLGRCLERGLAVDGRLIKFSVTVSDRPGGIAELCAQLARLGVSIKDIEHERAWIASDVFSVSVTVTCETRDMEHANELRATLNKSYTHIVFPSPAAV